MKIHLKSQNSNNSVEVKKKPFSLRIKLDDKKKFPLMKKTNNNSKKLIILGKNKRI